MKEYILDEHQIRLALKRILGDGNFTLDYIYAHFSSGNQSLARKVIADCFKSGHLVKSLDGYIVSRWDNPQPPKPGYCERARQLIHSSEAHHESLGFECNKDWKIIDYPIEDTVAIKFNHRGHEVDKFIAYYKVLEKHNAEVRLIKKVKDGSIVCIHFND